jgi:membrane protein required for colicin V production
MTKTDIVLLIPLLWGLYNGLRKGIIVEVSSILAIILGVYTCSKFSDLVADFLGTHIHSHVSSLYLSICAVIIVFVGVVIAVFFIAKSIQKLAKAIFLGIADRILGGLFGMLKWALLISFILYFFDILNQKAGIVSGVTLEHSWVYTQLLRLAPLVMPTLIKSKAKLLI